MENNNKLIAEFLGLETIRFNKEMYLLKWKKNLVQQKDDTIFKFDTDWNWLMEAVEKINDFNNVVSINENHVLIINNEKSKVIVDVVAGNMLEATYNAVVEFIKLHNEQ
jgi:hypothetical protein